MDMPLAAPAQTARQLPGIVDCDVHPTLKGGITDLYDYMAKPWRERFLRKRAHTAASGLTLRYNHPNGFIVRDDSATDTGAVGGSDPGFLIRDLLDGHGIELAILNSLQTGAWCAVHASADESIVIAQAANDFFLERWASFDKRLKYAAVVPSQDPLAAAAEIRRVGGQGQVVAVAVPQIDILLGNRYWNPIFEAAQEFDLPLLLHVSGSEGMYAGAPMPAGGRPDTYIERYVTLGQGAEANLNSVIMNGVFERFPRLRILFVEYGTMWPIPTLLRMDRLWRGLRHEVPWVKRLPSDYVDDHIWFTTQPLEEPKVPNDLAELLRMVGIGNVCFSTDYPHWDNDMPGQSLHALKAADRDAILRLNARNVLRLGS